MQSDLLMERAVNHSAIPINDSLLLLAQDEFDGELTSRIPPVRTPSPLRFRDTSLIRNIPFVGP